VLQHRAIRGSAAGAEDCGNHEYAKVRQLLEVGAGEEPAGGGAHGAAAEMAVRTARRGYGGGD
jgi:hypothetical protein